MVCLYWIFFLNFFIVILDAEDEEKRSAQTLKQWFTIILTLFYQNWVLIPLAPYHQYHFAYPRPPTQFKITCAHFHYHYISLLFSNIYFQEADTPTFVM